MLAFSFMRRLLSLIFPIFIPCSLAFLCYWYAAHLMGDKIDCSYADLIPYSSDFCADGDIANIAEKLNWLAFLLLLASASITGLVVFRKYQSQRDLKQRNPLKISN